MTQEERITYTRYSPKQKKMAAVATGGAGATAGFLGFLDPIVASIKSMGLPPALILALVGALIIAGVVYLSTRF